MSNRHQHNHSHDRAYKLGLSSRLDNDSTKKGRRDRLDSAVRSLDLDDKMEEYALKKQYAKLMEKP